MRLLLVILSAIMSWVINSKTSVSGEGAPEGVSATYACTYQKGDVRANDTATIVLSNMAGMTVEQIEVYVKSNKSSGAGVFTVEANGLPVATKSGTFKDWIGDYDNSEYHPIPILSAPAEGVNELSIRLVGTANSLHIQKYVISYTTAAPRIVTLMCGNATYQTLTETGAGAGVVLPSVPPVSSWEHIGWSPVEFWELEQLPEVPLYEPGSTFIPTEDGTLWAVYQQDLTPGIEYVTELSSGLYMYLNYETNRALTGVPAAGQMAVAATNKYDERQHYWVELLTDSTATITHAMTQTPIGYNEQAQLVAEPSEWKIYHEGDQTLFYTVIAGKNYVLWTEISDETGEKIYAGLLKAGAGPSPMRLLSTLIPERQITYTCHPEAQAIETVDAETQQPQTIMRFGNYELRLRKGQKELIVW